MAVGVLNTIIGTKKYGHPFVYTMEWATSIASSASGVEQRNQDWSLPRRHWVVNWPAVVEAQWLEIEELFSRLRGRYDTFLYRDDYRNEITYAQSGDTGDGTAGPFQMTQTFYPGETEEWTEDVKWIVPSSYTIKVAGVTQVEGVDYTIDVTDSGLITFLAGHFPGIGDAITWTAQRYFLCRLEQDSLELSNTTLDIVQGASLRFVQIKGA